MPMITCPECKRQISDKADFCPHCGLPSKYFGTAQAENPVAGPLTDIPVDYRNLPNLILSFDRDYAAAFGKNNYITSGNKARMLDSYAACYAMLSNDFIFQYVRSNAAKFKVDLQLAASFLRKYETLDRDIDAHNERYVDERVSGNKEYFDNILKDIDPAIKLDDEQRRAVVTDDDYCLLVAGAGAGKTTTMAAKVKYLVEKQRISPEDIIVISYTNKAIGELKERINQGLQIPAKVCTFHSFAYEIVKRFNDIPPEVNFSAYKIIFEMLEKAVFDNKPLMRNLVLFMGYYFDLGADVFEYSSLNEYHLRKAAQDYETIKSSLGEYVQTVAHQRSRQTKTITGEYLRSIQEVQIANFLYLNGLDYEYESVYPYEIKGARKKYTPDFRITQGEHTAYLEHYALSESGYSTIFTPAQIARYKNAISDKRKLHKRYGTTLLETWGLYRDRRSLLDHLKETLEKEGFLLKPRDLTEVYKKLVETGKDKYVYKLIVFLLECFQDELQEKAAKIPEKCMQSPNLTIAGPTLEALKYTFDEESIREMYVNLLTSSMDTRYNDTIHPGFVDIIKQLTPDEAKMLAVLPKSDLEYKPLIDLQVDLPNNKGERTVLRNYTNIFDRYCEYPENVSRYLENLERLKIITIPEDLHITADESYDGLERSSVIIDLKNRSLSDGEKYKTIKKLFYTTKFGVAFIKCCAR